MTLFKVNWHLSRYNFMQIIPQCGGVSAPGSLGGASRAAAGYPGAFNSGTSDMRLLEGGTSARNTKETVYNGYIRF